MKSIALRLWTYILVLILLILGMLWFLQTGLLSSFYLDREADVIKREVKAMASLETPEDINNLGDEAESLYKTYNAMVDVIDRDGRIVVESGRTMRGRVANVEASEFPLVIKGEERVIKSSETMMSGMQLLSIGVPIRYNSTILGAVFVHIPISSMEGALSALRSQFLLISVIAVIIATLGAFILSKNFTGPILKINNAAIDISKGEYETRVNIKYKDEIGRLADTVNNMASELSKVEKLRRDLIANISHEFRTPLGIIRSYGEGLIDQVYKDEEEKEEYLRIILDEALRLSRLVDDVLDMSKLQSGNLRIEASPFLLTSLVYRIHDKFKVLCKEKGVDLFVNCPDNLYAVGDEARIEQVLINLLNNSLNHTEKGGKININGYFEDDVAVEVVDTGEGISKEDLPYVFDRFYKADRTGKKSGAGTGLGLAIVKEILKSHDSDFGVESKVGQGTRFYLHLKKA